LSAVQLIGWLRSVGVAIGASEGRLRVTAEHGAVTPKIRQKIAEQKTALLELLAAEAAKAAGAPSDLVPVPRDRALPLSLFQQRLWVIHRIEPDSTEYNLATVWPLPGALDAARAEAAIRAVVRNNEILRSMFRDNGPAPRVDLLQPDAVSVVVRDLRRLGETEEQRIIEQDRTAATRSVFDLAAEAPVRWVVYWLSADRVAALIAAHHIALDEWSFALLRRQVEAACAAVANGVPTAPPPALQYVDYAAWQRRIEDSAAMSAELDWWENNLAGIPQLCTFPADRPAVTDRSGATRSFCWDAEFVAQLRAWVRAEGATLYMALLAICAVVLRAHNGQDDIVLGSPMGMRERPEFETMLGPFVNLLVLRLDLADDPSFSELLARARDAVLDAYDHRQVSFEMLVERLHPIRSFERPPLFQVAVVMHNASNEPAASIYSGGAIHDLTWYAREVEGRIEGSFEFRSDLYETDSIDRIARHLETALRAAVRDPRRKISELSLLSAAERETLLEGFNATAQELDPAPFIVQFERQAAAQPESPAFRFDGMELTYATLNHRANRLARHLIDCGLGAGDLVGVCLDRSPEMLVALLAVQKTGAAYLPLDPGFPPERLAFMLADSGTQALIVAADIAVRLTIPPGVRVIDLAQETDAIDDLDGSNPESDISPEQPVYMIYTSGSTGRPNGVVVSHGALANFLGSMRSVPGLSPADVVAAVTTTSFDIAALELYLPLIVGARIELVARETASDGRALAQLLSAAGASVLQATPATWRLLVEADWQGGDQFRAFCGGEALSRELADAVLERVGELWNLYGPTETTIWSTAEQVNRGTEAISIGRPIGNTRIYVLGPSGEPAPIGTPGEIWIGGDGVAIGYHQRPELAAARFVADPFAGPPGARMYRTGDLGRWGGDGRLFHMGRMDRQVKVRGFRIEPAEIEATLNAHPAISQAIVAARDLTQDHARLVAYIVYQPGEDLTASQARAHLRQALPEYMIPSVFVAMSALPLTPNGKVDMRALPDPFQNAMNSGGSYEPPAPGLEQVIADIWRDLLQVERIGADDNFFELGGHSLLSLRAAAAIEQRVGFRIAPRILFFQSLRQVAAAVRRVQANQVPDQ
jgi:amino acid adenylation domain-containing protein